MQITTSTLYDGIAVRKHRRRNLLVSIQQTPERLLWNENTNKLF